MGYSPPNRFLRPNGEGGRPPARMYARVDSVERTGPKNKEFVVMLDGVDAAQLDNMGLQALRAGGIREIGIGTIEIRGLPAEEYQSSESRDLFEEGQWLEISFGDAGAYRKVLYYANLFADPTEQPANISIVAKRLKAQLDQSFSLDDVDDAEPELVELLLAHGTGADYMSVLDVGQGNAAAFCGSQAGALLYFDLGGGVQGNVHTFPDGRRMCFTQRPAIVLSHWDWDHWSSGLRYGEALKSPWLVPRQALGAVHRAFAYELIQRGGLSVWPSGLSSCVVGSLTLIRCGGTSRNDSGLAMCVNVMRADGTGGVALLPGDAEYSMIPGLQPLAAVVASHHGAELGSIDRCVPAGANSAIVFSYGHGNTFGHPKRAASLDYEQVGWLSNRALRTAIPQASRPNDIALRMTTAPCTSGCGHCDPGFVV